MNTANKVLPIVIASIAISLFVTLSHGLSFLVTFVPAMLLSLVLYYFITLNNPLPNTKWVMTLYWLALAVQFLHFAEEFVTDFNIRWPVEIFNSTPYDMKLFIIFNMISYTIFTLGGLALYRGVKFPMIIVWFFVIMGVLGNGIQHPIYALIARGYFPGLYTSVLHLILGVVLIVTLIRESIGYRQSNKELSKVAI